ncbi:hypothetical protein HDU92_001955 [Lobulomyces angularis]|nr:hypothetical protein HDU92_001955 [Lobulomyces angularis]
MNTTEEHLLYWPYAKEQFEKINEFIGRLNLWCTAANDIVKFFTLMHFFEKQKSKFSTRLIKKYNFVTQIINQNSQSLIGLNNIFEPFGNSLINLENKQIEFEKSFWDQILKKLIELRLESVKYTKTIETELIELMNRINKERCETIKQIKIHENALCKRSIILKNAVDPWLTELILVKNLKLMTVRENQFQASFLILLHKIENFEFKIFSELQGILSNYCKLRETVIMENQKYAETSNAGAETFVSNFSSNQPNRTENFTVFQSKRLLEDFPLKINEIKLSKKGILKRKGGFLGKKWLLNLFCLTDTGFLHCFHASKCDKPDDINNYSFIYNDLKKPNAYFSINLQQSKISVEFVKEKAHLFVFEIKIYERKKKRMHLKKIQLKAGSEVEMIDWVALLRLKIDSYIPDGPPTLIFPEEESLMLKVEEAIYTGRSNTDINGNEEVKV